MAVSGKSGAMGRGEGGKAPVRFVSMEAVIRGGSTRSRI